MKKKPVYRAVRLGDILNNLMEAKYIIDQLQSSNTIEALRQRQKRQFQTILELLCDLIRDLEQDTAQEQLAS